MSYSLLNFDNVTFDGKLSNMRTLFAKGATNYEPSEYARQRFMHGQAMRTMDVIYDVLRIYKGDGNIDRFVGKAGDTLISEV